MIYSMSDSEDSDDFSEDINFFAAPPAFRCSEPYQFEPQLSEEAVQEKLAQFVFKAQEKVCCICLL